MEKRPHSEHEEALHVEFFKLVLFFLDEAPVAQRVVLVSVVLAFGEYDPAGACEPQTGVFLLVASDVRVELSLLEIHEE